MAPKKNTTKPTKAEEAADKKAAEAEKVEADKKAADKKAAEEAAASEEKTDDKVDTDGGGAGGTDGGEAGSDEKSDDGSSDSTGDKGQSEIDEKESGSEEEDDVKAPAPDLSTTALVAAYISSQDVGVEDKLETIAKHAVGKIRTLASQLKAAENDFGPNTPELPAAVIIGKLYNLYTIIRNVIMIEKQDEYKLHMDVLNMAIAAYSKPGDAFSPTMLVRYDTMWKWGPDALKTYQILVVIITSLANIETRADNLKKVNFQSSFARQNITISQKDIERMQRYYSR